MRPGFVAVSLLLVLVACTDGRPAPTETSPRADSSQPPTPAPLDERITAALLTAARDYPMWGRVDEHARVAPAPCADPNSMAEGGTPSQVRLSQADDGSHREKLYYLFAGLDGRSAATLYTALGEPPLINPERRDPSELPVGLTIVKQSWTSTSEPREVELVPAFTLLTPEPLTSVVHGDRTLHVGEQAELFIMIKLGPRDTPGTDAGWIYGTVSADGERVTSAGKVEPCMDCHAAAPHERLFGLGPVRQ